MIHKNLWYISVPVHPVSKSPFPGKWAYIFYIPHFVATLRYLHNHVENIIITLTKELSVSRARDIKTSG